MPIKNRIFVYFCGALLSISLPIHLAAAQSKDPIVSAVRISNPPLIYPFKMIDLQVEGHVDISCGIDSKGALRSCVVIRIQGASDFVKATTNFINDSTYRPALQGGVPVDEPNHTFGIDFSIDPIWPPEEDALAKMPPDWVRCLGYGAASPDRERAIEEACSRIIAAGGAPNLLGSAHLLRARNYARQGRYDEAGADYGEAIAFGVNPTYAHIHRGAGFLITKNYAKAKQDFDAVLKTSVRNISALRGEADAAFGLGEFALAQKNFEYLTNVGLRDPSIYIRLAEVLKAEGDVDAAFDALDDALEINSTEVPALAARCRLHQELGHPEKAAVDCARVKELDPTHKVSDGI